MTVAGASIEIQDKGKPVGKTCNRAEVTLDTVSATLASRLNVLHSKILILKSALYSL
jgi:hypothetical protein